MGTIHDESLRLEELLGVPPLIRVTGKRPLDREWTTGPREHASEWRDRLRTHDGNAGLVTGNGLVVVDADLYHTEAEDSLDRLYDLGLPRDTITVITGGGGRHLYYRSTEPIGSGPLGGFPGIDIKATGGYVVVPPSIHSSGNAYEWEHGWGPDDLEPADLPSGLVDVLSRSGTTEAGELDERDEEAVNLLCDHLGGHSPRNRGTYVEVTRPGKEERYGNSATVGAVGRGTVRVWSSNWEGLDAGTYGLSELRRLVGVRQPHLEVPELQPPDGFRWWKPGDGEHPVPQLGSDAYHGPLGRFLRHLEGRTEAHPAAVGLYVLTYLGASVGESVAFVAGDEIHNPRIWGALVGSTSSGKKGVAMRAGRKLIESIEPGLVDRVSVSGFGSGEALVGCVVDQVPEEERGSRPEPMKNRVLEDAELGNVLRVCKRDGSILSEQLRKAFDGDTLQNRTKGSGVAIATAHHIGTIGAITPTELLSLIDDVSIHNGFYNRVLWIHTARTGSLPFGGNLDAVEVSSIADQIADAYGATGARFPVLPGTEAGEVWREFYVAREDGVSEHGPVVEALTARHISHAARIALLYAVMDGASELNAEHIRAGIAWCDYSLGTVLRLFGGRPLVGDAGLLLEAVREAGVEGLDLTGQSAVFGRHRTAEQLEHLRTELESAHFIHTIRLSDRRTVSIALQPA